MGNLLQDRLRELLGLHATGGRDQHGQLLAPRLRQARPVLREGERRRAHAHLLGIGRLELLRVALHSVLRKQGRAVPLKGPLDLGVAADAEDHEVVRVSALHGGGQQPAERVRHD